MSTQCHSWSTVSIQHHLRSLASSRRIDGEGLGTQMPGSGRALPLLSAVSLMRLPTPGRSRIIVNESNQPLRRRARTAPHNAIRAITFFRREEPPKAPLRALDLPAMETPMRTPRLNRHWSRKRRPGEVFVRAISERAQVINLK